MAASKDPASYPAAFQILLEHFKNTEALAVHTYYERGEAAARMRFTFYNFKKALRHANDQGNLRIAQGVIVKLSPTDASGGASLEFSLRDNADYALDLEAAILRAQSGSTPSPQSQPLAERQPVTQAQPTSDELVDRYMAGGVNNGKDISGNRL